MSDQTRPTLEQIKLVELAICKLIRLEYPEDVTDTSWVADEGRAEQGSYNLGISDGFILSLRGLLNQAFPRPRIK